MAGTSAGAIIAAGAAAGIPAAEMLDLFMTEAGGVLVQRPWNVLARVVAGQVYSTQALHDLIAERLGPARDWAVNDSPIDLLIPATRLADGTPWYFVRDKPRNARRTGRVRLADCVTASAAAPTYFAPWTIAEDPATLPPGAEPIGTLVDGSVGVAGNPLYLACVEAFRYTGEYRPEETIAVSLGTGRFPARPRPTWLWPWLQWILSELLRSPGEQQTELAQRHYGELGMRLYRIDLALPREIPVDDPRNAAEVRRYGEALAARVDWERILAGTDDRFRVREDRTLFAQYCERLE